MTIQLPPRTFSTRAEAVVACPGIPPNAIMLPAQVISPIGNASCASFAIASDFSAGAACAMTKGAMADASTNRLDSVRFMRCLLLSVSDRIGKVLERQKAKNHGQQRCAHARPSAHE